MASVPNSVKRAMLGGRSVSIDGNTLDTTLQLMLAGQRAVGINGLVTDDDVAVARDNLEILTSCFKQDIPLAAVTNLAVPGPAGSIRARHYRPVNGDGTPLLVFYHGGGQVIGSIETHDDLCRQLCRAGQMQVLSVDYRLAPEHKAPAGSDDALAAFQSALDNAADLDADPNRVTVGGDSAGGNLAALVAMRARTEASPTADRAAAVLSGGELP